MLNTARGLYQHKRTNDLLKFKKVQTVDLYVVGIVEGTGKYEGMVGSLDCALPQAVSERENKNVNTRIYSFFMTTPGI